MGNTSGVGGLSEGPMRALRAAGLVAFLLLPAFAGGGVFTAPSPDGPAQTVFAPAGGSAGPVVLVLSGRSGPELYRAFAEDICSLGYYTVLLDGNDMINAEHTGQANFAKALERTRHAQGALPGKVAVIGFSLGGGGALNHATCLPENVSMVVAYYPFTRTWAKNPGGLAKRFQVPVLLLQGTRDHQDNDCCVVETARALEAEARAQNATFELVVYPDAEHGFNLARDAQGKTLKAYREGDAKDAWKRTVEMLKRWQPLP